MLPCRTVRLMARRKPLRMPYGIMVVTGKTIQNMKVVYARPNPCVLVPQTNISFIEEYRYDIEELKNNIHVILKGNNFMEHYIYPKKVWEIIEAKYIRPLEKGNPPREAGLVLYGPPGTGKTSMIEILSDVLGLYRIEIEPERVLSKWVGESEKKLAGLFKEAEKNIPSIVIEEDAEWLTRGRQFYNAQESSVSYTLMKISLKKIEEFKKKQKPVLVVVTTNMSPKILDIALIRSGRLGHPVFIPLPDYEAVEKILEIMGVDDKVLARRLASLGYSMADVREVARDIRDGLKPRIEPLKGRGYTRLTPPMIKEELIEKLKSELRFVLGCNKFVGKTRIWIEGSFGIVEPVLIPYLVFVCNKPIVLLIDDRYFDEALMTAETNNAVLVVDAETISPDVLRIACNIAGDIPLVFIGPEHHLPYIPVIAKADDLIGKIGSDTFVRLVLDYYGIKYDEKALHDLTYMQFDRFKNKVVPYLRFLGHVCMDDIRGMLE